MARSICRPGGGIACLSGSAPLIEGNEISLNFLEAGYGEFPPYSAGGGIYCDGTSPAEIRGCTVQGNSSGNGGAGGVDCSSPGALVEDCTIESNSGTGVGGFGSRGTLRRCVIRGNTGGWPHGSGGCRAGGECQITDCLIIGNSGGTWIEGGAGGIGISQGPVLVSGNTVVGNHAPGVAGIWMLFFDQSARIERNIVALNGQDGQGCGIAAPVSALRCNDSWGNEGGNYGSGDSLGLRHNISEDPLFCDPAGGNFYLNCLSPCAPAQQPDCGLIGAYDVGCGASATEPSTWGLVKQLFKGPGR